MGEHDITLLVGGQSIRPPISYSIAVDILTPCDGFSMSFPMDLHTYHSLPLDETCEIRIDGITILRGRIDTVADNGDGTLNVQGRDAMTRACDESVPGAGLNIGGKLLSDVVLDLMRPWFTKVVFSNATDRRLRRGRGRKTSNGREPALTAAQRRAIPRRIEAGDNRFTALDKVLEPLGLLAWASSTKDTIVITEPNYSQASNYEFFETLGDSNVKKMTLGKSVQSRYSEVEVSGSGRPAGIKLEKFEPSYPGQKRPKYVNRNRIGTATDESGDFRAEKRLFVVDDSLSTSEAQAHAERILAESNASARIASVTAAAHGQVVANNAFPTIYTVDTIATIYKEVESSPGDDTPGVLVNADYYITACTYTSDRQSGEVTQISLVPVGTRLS